MKGKDTSLLSRREFHERCVALGSLVTLSGVVGSRCSRLPSPQRAQRGRSSFTTALSSRHWARALGISGREDIRRADEEEALRTGLSLGMTLIDTSGNYGEGRSEQLIKRVIAGQRDRAFVVSKVEVDEVTGDAMARACQASLARLGTDRLDLYLLHWPTPSGKFSEVVAGLESLRAAGKIRTWGVSNFTAPQMEDLFHIPQGDRCATNQVHYNLGDRSIERDLMPWCERHSMPVMAYSPLGGTGAGLLGDPVLVRIAAARGCSAAAVALAWTIRNGNVIAIPESGSVEHVTENAVALSLTLTPQELQTLDAAHPLSGR